MVKKLYLDSTVKPEGTVWFTLVFENPTKFFVEELHDSNLPFVKHRVETISAADLDERTINGVSMKKVVVAKLNEVYGFS
jgi:hypothetical protein